MGAFELAMTDQNLTFSNENQDKLALYQMSEKFDKNWFELFNLANKSKNSDGTINISQLRNRLVSQTQKAPVLSSFDKPCKTSFVLPKIICRRDKIKMVLLSLFNNCVKIQVELRQQLSFVLSMTCRFKAYQMKFKISCCIMYSFNEKKLSFESYFCASISQRMFTEFNFHSRGSSDLVYQS